MYKGKFLNNGPLPHPAPVPTPEEIDKEALLEQTLKEHQQEQVAAEPVYQSPDEHEEPAPQKKKSKKGTIIFYSIYGAFVVAAIAAIFIALSPLKEWLINFEISQPESKCQVIYDQYFKNPDWSSLYDMAGIEDTQFEGKEAFVQYMTAKIAAADNGSLEYQETAAGLSGNKKYNLKLDGEKVGCFFLEPTDNVENGITTWNLGDIELYFTRDESAIIEILPEHKVTVNGVALDDSYTIRTTSTKAEAYLPEGLHGFRSKQVYVDGLLVAPQIVVTDAAGNSVPLITDAETGIKKATPQPGSIQIPEEHKEIARVFGENFAKYAIRKIGVGTLAKYMDSTSQCYKDVRDTHPFLQKFYDYKINDIVVEDYYAYSDSLFSARIQLTMDVHAVKNGNIKHFEMDTTFFFEKKNDKFLVVDKTNVDISEPVEQVRLTFMNGDKQVDRYMVDADTNKIATPLVTPPAGKVLKGWAIQEVEENGNIKMTILFTPEENGTCAVNQTLEPMVLHAVFDIEE